MAETPLAPTSGQRPPHILGSSNNPLQSRSSLDPGDLSTLFAEDADEQQPTAEGRVSYQDPAPKAPILKQQPLQEARRSDRLPLLVPPISTPHSTFGSQFPQRPIRAQHQSHLQLYYPNAVVPPRRWRPGQRSHSVDHHHPGPPRHLWAYPWWLTVSGRGCFFVLELGLLVYISIYYHLFAGDEQSVDIVIMTMIEVSSMPAWFRGDR